MSRRSPNPPIPGIIHTTMQLPEELHETMKTLQLAHREIDHEHIPLCRLYQEAVEVYLNAKRQRELLAQYHNLRPRSEADPPEPLTQEALCADR